MKKITKNRSGLTLVELMVASTIIAIIMVGISTFFTQGINFFRVSQAKLDVQRDARSALDNINRQLRQAKASTIVIDRKDTAQPPYSRIYFETIRGKYVTFYQDVTSLYQLVGDTPTGGHKNLLSDNLETISFTYPQTDDDTILHVSLCMVKVPHPYIKGAKALQLSIAKVRVMND